MVALAPIFMALEKGLSIWDHYNKTSYARELRELTMLIAKEEAKPVYPDEIETDITSIHLLRNQAKIDDAHLKIVLLSRRFIEDKSGDPNGV